MPGAAERVGEPFRHVDAVKGLAFDGVMGREAADKHLENEQRHDDEQILAQRLLRRREADRQHRVLCRGPWLGVRSEENTSELQSLMRHSNSVSCLKKQKQ